MDPDVTFELDRYEPVAFHTYPALMRAAEARTEVLHPATQSSEPDLAMATPGSDSAVPVEAPVEEPVKPDEAPVDVPVAAYLVGVDATGLLREQLADFLDAAGTRGDVRVSVGLSWGSRVEWVLRDAVPYGVRAMPRYPSDSSAAEPEAALNSVGSVLANDASAAPDRRQLVVVVWDRPPVPVRLPASLASALVLHCVDAVLDRPPQVGWGASWLLSRSRPHPPRSLLAQAGRLLAGWEAFVEIPDGLVLTRLG